MFVHDFVELAVPVERVTPRFETASQWLPDLATAAYRDGEARRRALVDGPGAVPGPAQLAREVVVRLDLPRWRVDGLVVGFRWEATPPALLFPRLLGDLEVAPVGPAGSQLAVSGSYDPPEQRRGGRADELAIHRIVCATVRDLLGRAAALVRL